VRVLSQVGASREDLALAAPSRDATGPLRLLSIGRLLHWKGFDLGLRAFAAAQLGDAEYWILGAGPEQRALQRLARRLGIESRVHFAGDVPRAHVLGRLRLSHLLVHPSLHESGGGVCCEALAMGCPVACLDLGGPALQVNEDSGFRIPARDPERAVAELAEMMVKLAGDRTLLARKSRDARRAAHELSWERKCEQLSALYRSVLERDRGLAAD
jgi:glycosyltransferase involved in cell wall biosynthesis